MELDADTSMELIDSVTSTHLGTQLRAIPSPTRNGDNQGEELVTSAS